MNKISLCAVALLILILAACGGSADSENVATETPEPTPVETPEPADDETALAPDGGALNVDEEGRALRGFDPVAYHADGAAVAGVGDFSHQWQGATWLFSTAENRDAFATEPERYAPMNGGYCTFGVVLGKKLDVDPQRFLVQDDSLFLFLNAEVQEKFNADLDGNLELVTSNWPGIADKHPDELDKEAG